MLVKSHKETENSQVQTDDRGPKKGASYTDTEAQHNTFSPPKVSRGNTNLRNTLRNNRSFALSPFQFCLDISLVNFFQRLSF